MASFNKVILMGHLTRDPETATLPGGTEVCEFALAVNRRWKDRQEQLREETLFIDCSAFGNVGKTIGAHFKKGKPIHLEGHLKLDSWEAQDGTKRSKIRVVVQSFRFVEPSEAKGASAESAKGKASRNGTGRGKRPKVGAAAPEGAGLMATDASQTDADIPF